MANDKIHIEFPGRIVFIGFGSIGQGTLPLVLRHIGIPKERITIITGGRSRQARMPRVRHQVRE